MSSVIKLLEVKLLIHKCIEKYFAKGYYPSPPFSCAILLFAVEGNNTGEGGGGGGGFEQKPADTFMLKLVTTNILSSFSTVSFSELHFKFKTHDLDGLTQVQYTVDTEFILILILNTS